MSSKQFEVWTEVWAVKWLWQWRGFRERWNEAHAIKGITHGLYTFCLSKWFKTSEKSVFSLLLAAFMEHRENPGLFLSSALSGPSTFCTPISSCSRAEVDRKATVTEFVKLHMLWRVFHLTATGLFVFPGVERHEEEESGWMDKKQSLTLACCSCKKQPHCENHQPSHRHTFKAGHLKNLWITDTVNNWLWMGQHGETGV